MIIIKSKELLKITIYSLILLVVTLLCFKAYTDKLNYIEEKTTKQQLIDVSKQNLFITQTKISDTLNMLELISDSLIQFEQEDVSKILSWLTQKETVCDFTRLAFISLDGTAHYTNGKTESIRNKEYFYYARLGQRVLSNFENENSSEGIVLAIPMYKKNEIVGILRCDYEGKEFESFISSPILGYNQNSYIINIQGKIITKNINNYNYSSYDNIYTLLESPDLKLKNQSLDTFKSEISLSKTGILEYSHNNTLHYVYYTPIGYSNWYYISSTSLNKSTNSTTSTYFLTFNLIFSIIVLFMAFILLTVYELYSIIKKQKISMIELEIEKERYKLVSYLTNDYFFDYDTTTNILTFSDNFSKDFNISNVINNYKEYIKNNEFIHEDDIDNLILFAHNILKTNIYSSFEFRLKVGYDLYEWFKIICHPIYSEDRKKVKVIGKMLNVNQQKQEYKSLILKSKLDSLTNLYNRSAAEEEINNYLTIKHENEFGALFIIDIDFFKTVNDVLGHVIGDKAIIETAAILKSVLRTTDIVARLGGDEFIVFMKNPYSLNVVLEKARLICNKLERRFESEDTKKNVSTSASIGVVIAYNSNETFKELYKKADSALYESKEKGKNCYTVYK